MLISKHRCALLSLLLVVCAFELVVSRSFGLSFTGVSLAGAEFGETVLPGTYNTNYTYPTTAELDYFLNKGMNTFRIPFRWERLQHVANGALDATELSRLNTVVNYATSHGAYVELDPHNYARYFPSSSNTQGDPAKEIGTSAVPNSAFDDFWSRLASQYKTNSHVIFGLMNEPNSMPTTQWRDAAQEAINTIRTAGANNLILVPGNRWTGAWTWNNQDQWGISNAQAMLAITDPGNNFAFEVHQYLDSNGSGGADVVSATVGRDRLVSFTNWLHANNRRGFLGEFAVPNSTVDKVAGGFIGDDAINNMLGYVESNLDVWLGWTWWAAGPWWGEYQFTAEPKNLGQPTQSDRAVLPLLQSHLAIPGDYDGNGIVDAADYVSWRKSLAQSVTAGTSADGNGDGQIGSADYAILQQNFGKTRLTYYAASSAFATIPEPGKLALAISVALILITYSTRRRICLRAP